ncbi:MAG: hypothetical protein CVV50_03355 [Spirochaetae bacterium HGW-Spirochaetae-6]|nr:MAG: hypothetical protein CVV50_03355 [Spirochaetae bacterium HGW-Spirochaetae-6]
MKKLTLFLLILFLFSACGSDQTLKSAAVEKSKTFIFEIQAKSVFLSGNFNQWQTDHPSYAFQETSPGQWKLTLPHSLLLPGKNEYKVIADGEWHVDPSAPQFETNPLSGKVGVFFLSNP